MVTGDSALQIITFLVPLDVCLLLILHLPQQADWASITLYAYILYIHMHSLSYVFPKCNNVMEHNPISDSLFNAKRISCKMCRADHKEGLHGGLLYYIWYAAGAGGAGVGRVV